MNREWRFCVYIVASRSRHIYPGVTNDIERRIQEHKRGEIGGFTQRYKINRLVYSERFRYIGNAIEREKEIKSGDRKKRAALIEGINPTWEDLSLEWGKPVELLHPSCANEKQIPRFARDDNPDNSASIPESYELLVTKK
jgi:putative endonuclease